MSRSISALAGIIFKLPQSPSAAFTGVIIGSGMSYVACLNRFCDWRHVLVSLLCRADVDTSLFLPNNYLHAYSVCICRLFSFFMRCMLISTYADNRIVFDFQLDYVDGLLRTYLLRCLSVGRRAASSLHWGVHGVGKVGSLLIVVARGGYALCLHHWVI